MRLRGRLFEDYAVSFAGPVLLLHFPGWHYTQMVVFSPVLARSSNCRSSSECPMSICNSCIITEFESTAEVCRCVWRDRRPCNEGGGACPAIKRSKVSICERQKVCDIRQRVFNESQVQLAEAFARLRAASYGLARTESTSMQSVSLSAVTDARAYHGKRKRADGTHFGVSSPACRHAL